MNLKDAFKVRPAGLEKEGYIITIGNHLATEEVFETQRKAEAAINKTNWDMVAALICTIIEGNKKEEEAKIQEESKNQEGV